MSKNFTITDILTIVAYVEVHTDHEDSLGYADCGCDGWSELCEECESLYQRAALVLKQYGYPHEYADGELSPAANSAAELIYARYCVQYGHTPSSLSV